MSDLPSSKVFSDPEIEGCEDHDDEEAEGLVIHHKAKDKVEEEGSNFEGEMQHAVAGMRSTLEEPGYELFVQSSRAFKIGLRLLTLFGLLFLLLGGDRIDLAVVVVFHFDLHVEIVIERVIHLCFSAFS